MADTPPPAPPEAPLADRLRDHVARLAGGIGERNVRRARALHAAADYIRGEWQLQGHVVTAQRYIAYEVPCENLEVTRAGAATTSG